MRFPADLPVWAETWLSLALGAAVIISLAVVGARLARQSIWQRTVWQVCVLSLAVMLVGEVTGLTSGVIQWSRSRTFLALPQADAGSQPADNLAMPDAFPTLGTPFTEPRTSNSVPSTPYPIPSPQFSVPSSPYPVQLAIGITWISGTVALLLRTAVGQLALVAFRCRHDSLDDKPFLDRLHVLASQLGLRRVRVLAADGLTGPIAFGWLWPTIGLPRRFVDQFAWDAREAMLAHELGHLAARDPAWHFLADLVTAALWWHPLVWFARHQLRMASEFAADEACLVVRDGPGVLAACLVEFGRRLTMPPSQAWLRIEGNALRSGLARRVTRLLAVAGQNWQPPARVPFVLAKGIGPTAMVAVALMCTTWLHPLVEEKGASMSQILQQSWRQSLAAIALVSVFGSAETTVVADEPDLKVRNLRVVQNKEIEAAYQELRARQLAQEAAEAAELKERLAKMKQEIAELQKVGRQDEAEKLAQHLKELVAQLEKANAKEPEKEQDKEAALKSWIRSRDAGIDELHARLKQLEAENAELRQLVKKMAPQVELKEKGYSARVDWADVKPKVSGQKIELYRADKSGVSLEEVAKAVKQIQGQLDGLQKEVNELRGAVKKGDDDESRPRR